jgi:ribosome biogenesis GTPase
MRGPKKSSREKDITGRYLSGRLGEDELPKTIRYSDRTGKHHTQNKIIRTAELRATEQATADLDALPTGEVQQVFSQFSEVLHDGVVYLCVIRKTMQKLRDTSVIVGDRVKFTPIEGQTQGDTITREGVIERIEPRDTVLTRADSFKAIEQHPIVANAKQMLIVASLALPNVKWGLVDRMITAARAGGLVPIVCLNKLDLKEAGNEHHDFADEVMAYYQTLGLTTLQTSVDGRLGLNALRNLLLDRVTVLAGHSGVGKSSLIRAIEPSLDLRVAPVSNFNQKGRHTTTSARRYPLSFGGSVIDTPGVKLFGLWNVTRANISEFFPDVAAETAPEWRVDSYQRIVDSLPQPAF